MHWRRVRRSDKALRRNVLPRLRRLRAITLEVAPRAETVPRVDSVMLSGVHDLDVNLDGVHRVLSLSQARLPPRREPARWLFVGGIHRPAFQLIIAAT